MLPGSIKTKNRAHSRFVVLWLVFGAASTLGACGAGVRAGGGSDAAGPLECTPGETVSCGCTDGTTGTQSCKEDGTFGSCSCSLPCVSGRTQSCQCSDGRLGAQSCSSTGYFGACVCTGEFPDAGRMDGGGSVDAGLPDGGLANGGADGGSADGGPENGGGVVFHSGTDTLIDLFPTARGIIVVRSTAVELRGANGDVLASVASPREITAAAFDGTLLGVADKAVLTTYDANLVSQRSINLVNSCSSAVMVSRARFVCGPPNDWDRVFSTYDLSNGTLLGNSQPYTYDGLPMRRVPGTDDFVSVDVELSPAHYFLYRVSANSTITNLGENPDHGAFEINGEYAFDASPPTHLITPQGIMLKLYATDGGASMVRDGDLGTLANSESFTTLTDDGSGTAYGIVGQGNWYDGLCQPSCLVERIDVGARVIRATQSLSDTVGAFVVTRFDPFRHQLLVGYLLRGTSFGTYSGYRIVTFSLE